MTEEMMIEEMAKHCCFPCDFECPTGCSEGRNPQECATALETAKALYAADYRKQTKGAWIGIYYYQCSVCTGESEYKTKYCPHCGAKMK